MDYEKILKSYVDKIFDEKKSYTFISYSHAEEDKEKVYPFLIKLMENGINFVLDVEYSKKNGSWTTPMSKRLRNKKCKCMLTFGSKTYIYSRPCLIEQLYRHDSNVKGSNYHEQLKLILVSLLPIVEMSTIIKSENSTICKAIKGKYENKIAASYHDWGSKTETEKDNILDDNYKLSDAEKQYLKNGLSGYYDNTNDAEYAIKELQKFDECSIEKIREYMQLVFEKDRVLDNLNTIDKEDDIKDIINMLKDSGLEIDNIQKEKSKELISKYDKNKQIEEPKDRLSEDKDKSQEIKEIQWNAFESIKSFSYNDKYYNVKDTKNAYIAIVDIVRGNNPELVTKDIIEGETPYYVQFENGQELDMPNGGYEKILKRIPQVDSSVKLYSEIYKDGESVKEFEILKRGENVSSKEELIEPNLEIYKDGESAKEIEILEQKLADPSKEEFVELNWVNWNKKLPDVKPYTFRVEFMGRNEEHIKIWKDVWRKTIDLICVNPEIREKFSELREDIIENEGSLKTFFCGQKSKSGDNFSTKYEIEALGFAVEAYWNQEGFCKEIIKLFGELEIDLNELRIYGILEQPNEEGKKLKDFTNQDKEQKTTLIKYQIDSKEFETSQNVMMYTIFELLLNEHPESLIEVIDKMKCVSYVNNIKRKEDNSDIISYYRNFKEIEISGKKIIVGSSFSVEGKISQIKSLMLICGENFEQRIKIQSLDREDCGSKSKRQGNMFFHCFGEKYEQNTGADFITIVVQKLFEQYPDRMILGDIVTDNSNNNFRAKNSFVKEEKVYYVDTHSSTVSKYRSIKKLMQKMRIDPYNEKILTVKDKADDELQERTVGELTEK